MKLIATSKGHGVARSQIGNTIIVLACIFSGLMFLFESHRITKVDPWIHNMDMDCFNLSDATLLNSNRPTFPMSQPGLPTMYTLALAYRLAAAFGIIKTWSFQTLFATANPLLSYPALIAIGRLQSLVLAASLIGLGAATAWKLTGSWRAATLCLILLAGSDGVLFQSLIIRPELLCALFGNILAFYFVWTSTRATSYSAYAGPLLISGVCVGLAVQNKMTGVAYLPALATFCILNTRRRPLDLADSAIQLDGRRREPTFLQRRSSELRLCFGPGAAMISAFALLSFLTAHHSSLSSDDSTRYRIIAAVPMMACLCAIPMLRLRWRFIAERLYDVSLLLSGLLLSLVLTFALLRLFLSGRTASDELSSTLWTILNAEQSVRAYATNPHIFNDAKQFFNYDKVSILLLLCLSVPVLIRRHNDDMTKRTLMILLLTATGMMILMSKRYYATRYLIFTEVPISIALSLVCCRLCEAVERRKIRFLSSSVFALVVLTACLCTRMSKGAFAENYLRFSPDIGYEIDMMYRCGELDQHYRDALKTKYRSDAGFEHALRLMLQDPAPHQ